MRPLDVQRVSEPDRGIALVDRLGISETTFIPEHLLPIVGRCTGELSIAEIHSEAAPQYADSLAIENVHQVVQQLDERLLLLGERYDAAVRSAVAAFIATGTRASSQAGSAGYPPDPESLRAALDRMLDAASASETAAAPPRGLIAPHIDLQRGAAGYGAAYHHLLAAEAADLYVVFGTGHADPAPP